MASKRRTWKQYRNMTSKVDDRNKKRQKLAFAAVRRLKNGLSFMQFSR